MTCGGWITELIRCWIKKVRFEWEEGFLWRFLIYPALFIALLLFVFRNSTVRTFFLTLLTIVLLMIFTGLVMIGITNPEETTFPVS